MASSIPQFYSDYSTSTTIFPNDFCEQLPPPTTSSSVVTGGPLWGGGDTLVPLFDDFALHHHQQQQPTTLSPISQFSSDKPAAAAIDPTSFPQQDIVALPQLNIPSVSSINNAAAAAATSGCQSFCPGCQPDHNLFDQFRDDCFGLVPEIKPLYHPLPPDNWEIQSNQVPVAEDSNMKVGRYSEEVRKERILRYLKKRNQRNFNKTIKYACRKTLADRRIRVRGRFARNNEASDQEVLLNHPIKNNDTSIHKDSTELLYNHDHHVGVQMKKDEEEWLQEITSLMYLPYY